MNTSKPKTEFLSIRKTASVLLTDEATVLAWIRAGVLPSVRRRGHQAVPVHAVRRLLGTASVDRGGDPG